MWRTITEVGRISDWARTRLTADRSSWQAPERSSRFPKSVVSITDTSVARRKRHVPSLPVECAQCLREYPRLALHFDRLPFFKSTESTGGAQRRPFDRFNAFEGAAAGCAG